MRIERDSSPEGSTFRIYRGETRIPQDIVTLIVAIHQSGVGVIIGPSKMESDLVFVVGPLKGAQEVRFVAAVESCLRSQAGLDEQKQDAQPRTEPM